MWCNRIFVEACFGQRPFLRFCFFFFFVHSSFFLFKLLGGGAGDGHEVDTMTVALAVREVVAEVGAVDGYSLAAR